jgi:preprotein translocase subunit SecA
VSVATSPASAAPGPPPPVQSAEGRGASRLREVLGRGSLDGLETYRPLVVEIGALEPELSRVGDDALRRGPTTLRGRARDGESLDDLLVQAFALVREVAHRVLGQRPFDVQIAGGIALHHGRVAEMQTGEGKTLAAVAPVFLNSLTGRGAHVLTFNDYLAHRDARWMGPVYESLGLSVGYVQEGMTVVERQRAYACDVTYLTAKEAGFDLLRDSLCLHREEQVHRRNRFTGGSTSLWWTRPTPSSSTRRASRW